MKAEDAQRLWEGTDGVDAGLLCSRCWRELLKFWGDRLRARPRKGKPDFNGPRARPRKGKPDFNDHVAPPNKPR